jgi:hypothetical protein
MGTRIRDFGSAPQSIHVGFGLTHPLGIIANTHPASQRVHPLLKRVQFPLRIIQRQRHIGVFIRHLAHPALES